MEINIGAKDDDILEIIWCFVERIMGDHFISEGYNEPMKKLVCASEVLPEGCPYGLL